MRQLEPKSFCTVYDHNKRKISHNNKEDKIYWLLAILHWRSASLKPSQRLRSDWFWAHSRNCFISQEQAPAAGAAGAPWPMACGSAAATGAAASLPPLKSPVIAWPMVCPTADPMATPPAVAAIWPMRDGCCGWATMGDAGGAWAGNRDGAGAGAGARLTLKRGRFRGNSSAFSVERGRHLRLYVGDRELCDRDVTTNDELIRRHHRR